MRYTIASRKVCVALFFGLAVPLVAHSDIIALQLPNIPGDTRFAAANGLPADSIRVLTVGSSAEQVGGGGVGGGGGSGKTIFSDVSVTKKFGESSAPIFLTVARGTFLPTATISFYRMRQGVAVRYYTITLQEVSIASQSWVGNSNAVDAPDTENIKLTYTRITLLDDETGSRACFDVKTNQTC